MGLGFEGWRSIFIRLMAVARYRFIVELTGLFIVFWLACAVLVVAFELGHNQRIHSLGDAVYGLLVTMTTSGDSSIVPTTAGGRIVMGVAVIVSKLLTALLCALAAAVLIERKVKEDMGLKMHRLSQHIVIVGWNLKGPQIVRTLREDPNHATTPILVMADLEHRPVDDPLVLFTRSPFPIRGDALQRACLSQAATVVVLANYAERQHADTLTAINCLITRQQAPQARIITELLDPGQHEFLDAAGADLVVGIGEVGGFLLAEATIGNEQAQQLLAYVAHSTKGPAPGKPASHAP